jgi:hypothetical protein
VEDRMSLTLSSTLCPWGVALGPDLVSAWTYISAGDGKNAE